MIPVRALVSLVSLVPAPAPGTARGPFGSTRGPFGGARVRGRLRPRVVRLPHHLAQSLGGGFERGAQCRVPHHQPVQRAAQCRAVDGAVDPEGQADVVGAGRGVALVQQPEPLLLGGGRRGAGTGRDGRRRVRRTARAASGLDGGGQFRDVGAQHQALGQFAAPAPAHLGTQAQGLQRVASAGDPAVVRAQARHAQHPAGQVEHLTLQRGGGRGRGRALGAPPGLVVVAPQQGGLVGLAVGVQREFVDQVEAVRPHVRRQAGRQVAVEVVEVEAGPGHQVGQQLVDALLLVPARADVGLPDRRVGQDVAFQLAGLDTEAADLHLPVGAPHVGEEAVGAACHQVAGAVVAGAAPVVPGQPYEAARGLVRQVAVAGRQRVPGEEEFAQLAGGGRADAVGDHECLGARQRPADGHHVAGEVARDGVAQGEGGGLRGAVDVVEPGGARAVVPVPAADQRGVELLTADQHLADAGEAVRDPVDHGVEKRHGHEERVDAPAPQLGGEQVGGLYDVVLEDHAAAAGQQRDPHLEAQRVERGVGQAGVARAFGQIEVAGPGQPQDSGVAYFDALGTAGGAGGVEDEGDRHGAGREGASVTSIAAGVEVVGVVGAAGVAGAVVSRGATARGVTPAGRPLGAPRCGSGPRRPSR